MTGHKLWDTLLADPMRGMTQEARDYTRDVQLAYLNGYILALEDTIKDLEAQLGHHNQTPAKAALESAIQTVQGTWGQAQYSLRALEEIVEREAVGQDAGVTADRARRGNSDRDPAGGV